MSYDLFFRPTARTVKFNLEEVAAYFSSRANFIADGGQFLYQNEDTGVYFLFEHVGENEEDAGSFPISFNLNYFRPQVFSLEAELEVKAFVSHFQLEVDDPQTEGMGKGEYSSEGFLKGWDHGNDATYSMLFNLPDRSQTLHTLPAEIIKRYWRWNYMRANFQKEIVAKDLGIFIPKIMFGLLDGKVISMASWTDGIPTYLPQVDKVFIFRDQLAPRRLFAKKQSSAFVDWTNIKSTFSFNTGERVLPYLALDYPERPKAIEDFIRRLDTQKLEIIGISLDQVLDREIVAKYRKDLA